MDRTLLCHLIVSIIPLASLVIALPRHDRQRRAQQHEYAGEHAAGCADDNRNIAGAGQAALFDRRYPVQAGPCTASLPALKCWCYPQSVP